MPDPVRQRHDRVARGPAVRVRRRTVVQRPVDGHAVAVANLVARPQNRRRRQEVQRAQFVPLAPETPRATVRHAGHGRQVGVRGDAQNVVRLARSDIGVTVCHRILLGGHVERQ